MVEVVANEENGQVSGQGAETVREAALKYARRGWKVFPVKDKLPLVMWQDEATTDEAKINEWWTTVWPDAGVAIKTGDGLVVLDVDAKSGGLESVGKLFEEYREKLQDTPVVRTGGGGLHFYFSTDRELRNKTGIRPGIDIRGDGGYVVAVPSPHHSGNAYRWEEEQETLAPWPFDLHKIEAAAAVSEEDGIPAGQRNSTLTSLAGSMRRRGMTELAIREALLVENREQCHPPLPDNEVKAIARSIARYEPTARPAEFEEQTIVLNAKEFVEQVVEAPDWLIEGLWTSSAIGFIVGPPKVFKSFLALEMAFSVATGRAFLGMFTVPEPRTVLLIQEESSRAAFKDRVRRIGAAYGGLSTNLNLISNVPFNLESKTGAERLRWVVQKYRPALLVLDPLSSFVRGDQNDAKSMGDFIRSLIDLRNEFETAVAIVHHAKKSDPKDFRGSSALYASSEVTIRMYRMDESLARSKVTFELKDAESPDTLDVVFQSSTGTLRPITQTQQLAQALGGQERREGYWNND